MFTKIIFRAFGSSTMAPIELDYQPGMPIPRFGEFVYTDTINGQVKDVCYSLSSQSIAISLG